MATTVPETKTSGPIGARMKRVEDPRLITGAARYLDDVVLPGMAYVAILRSPHAHARINGIDTSRAAAAPGVVGVFTGQDFADVPALPCAWQAGGALIKGYDPVAMTVAGRHMPGVKLCEDAYEVAADADALSNGVLPGPVPPRRCHPRPRA